MTATSSATLSDHLQNYYLKKIKHFIQYNVHSRNAYKW